ncbi:hypothetical protein F5Y18DRAFT_71532 [Xylariaceae sp. FL1019]|nr:hypothetical protein F5Y18DRAFT_71532 [Xylariaceae sp. FL1019]
MKGNLLALGLAIGGSHATALPSVSQHEERAVDEWTSDPFYPSPWVNYAADGWTSAHKKAKDFVSQLTLLEKVNLTTGVG